MASRTFDVIVIGAGPGGYVAAIRAAQNGKKVVIVEREHLGGICLNWGCIPTKALLRSAEVFHLFHRAKEFGLSVEKPSFDFEAVIKRSRGVAKQLSGGIGHLMKKNKIEVVMGAARLAGKGRVTVTTAKGAEDLEAPAIVLATGARARSLPGMEPDGELIWNYKHALQPPRMPKELLVIGSGAIGIEFASFFNTMGAKVTVVEVAPRILPVEDEEVSAFARKQFVKQGMTILEGAKVTLQKGQGKVTASLEAGGKTEQRDFDTVISAVGIVGNVEDLGLEEAGVKVERTHVVTDEFCRTGVEGVFAIGDVAGAPWLAHKASHEGVMVADMISGKHVHPIKPGAIAGCTYCHPQVASVGYTEARAKEVGHEVRVGRFPFIGNGKAIALGEPEGFVKTVFDAKTGELLGAHMVGAEVTELIQGYIVGRALETTEAELMETVFPHPTLSEMMHEAVLDAYGRAIHY
jgi:dihydrolipoamide dehydrogenase